MFIACTGYPGCRLTMSLPRALEDIKMTDETCQDCFKLTRKNVYKFKLDFITEYVNEAMQEVLPFDDNTSGVFCVINGCDPNYRLLCESTFGLSCKRTFDNAFQKNNNGIPNYYYQKP